MPAMARVHDRVFLVGCMGAGKSTVGRRLARETGLEFVDSDQVIVERTGVTIPTIFEIEGEEGFRRREKEVVDELSRREGIVLATGGGVVLDPDNRRHLSERGFVVYLRASLEQIEQRTRHDRNRPLLQRSDRREVLDRLLRERDPLYREVADLVIETEHRSLREIIHIIRQRMPPAASGSDSSGRVGGRG